MMSLSMRMKMNSVRLAIIATMAFPIAANAGGVIGGGQGGDSMKSQPATIDDVELEAWRSQSKIIFFIQAMVQRKAYQKAGIKMDYNPVFDKLIGTNRDFIQLTKGVRISLQSQNPCFDSTGKAVDGSADINKPGEICLSAYRLAGKLNKANVTSEIPALVLHEISHLAGTNEEEAFEIQRVAIDVFRKYAIKGDLNLEAIVNVSFLRSSLHIAAIAARSNQKIDYSDLYDLYMHMVNVAAYMDEGFYHEMLLVNPIDFDRFAQLAVRIEAMSDYLCGIQGPHGRAPDDMQCGHDYAKTFATSSQVTVKSYLSEIPHPYHPLVTVYLQKINSQADIAAQLDDLATETERLMQRLRLTANLSFAMTGCQATSSLCR